MSSAYSNSSNPKIIRSIAEFWDWVNGIKGQKILYRGLANKKWPISASLYRRLEKGNHKINARMFKDATQRLVDSAKREGHDYNDMKAKPMENIQLLATLQHHGAATCLIDFTESPLVALWFACQTPTDLTDEHEDMFGEIILPIGKIVVINTRTIDKYENTKVFPIDDTGKMWKWHPPKHDNRIIAQHSVFIFGKPEISDDEIYCFCHIENKEEILKELKKQNISAASLFCDFGGFAREINGHDKKYEEWNHEDYFDFGFDHQQKQKFEEAIHYYDKAIEIDPIYVIAHYNCGISKSKLGDYSAAIADFDKAIEIKPDYADAYLNRGVAKSKLGDYSAAIADYNKALEINPKYAEAYYSRGYARDKLGDYEGAIVDFDKAIEINHEYAKAYLNRGIVKRKLKKYKDAIIDFDKAIEINHEYAVAYHNRGFVKYALGYHSDAIEDYNKAIEINPKNVVVYINRGVAKNKLGDYEGAITDYNKAIKINPDYAVAYLNRGNAKSKLGHYRDAIKDYSKAIKINPEYALAYYNRGIAKAKSGDMAGAKKDFIKANRLDSKFVIPDEFK